MQFKCFSIYLTSNPKFRASQFVASVSTATQPLRGLVYVPSRRQAQLTAIDLITFASADGTPNLFRRGRVGNVEDINGALEAAGLSENVSLASCVRAGVGFMHEGTLASERALVERLFAGGMLSIVVATAACAPGMSVSAWGSHLVVVQV
jgi:pre-mRNA-splicing helicase BRR2